MGLFKKNDRVIDLTEYYRKKQASAQPSVEVVETTTVVEETSTPANTGFFGGFFGNTTPEPEATPQTYGSTNEEGAEEKRKRLARRLKDMTDKIEDISNQIYHLQQRIEVVERRMDSDRY